MKLCNIAIIFDESQDVGKIIYSFNMLFHPLQNKDIKLKFNQYDGSEDAVIEYRRHRYIENSVHINPQNVILLNSCNLQALKPGKYRHGNFRLYSVELNPDHEKPFYQNGSITFDIIETVFFHLSRMEELDIEPHMRDKHGRMKSEYQFLVRNELHRIPVVDHIRAAFYEILGLSKVDIKTNYIITHDIDCTRRFGTTKRVVRAFARTIFKEKSPSRLLQLTKQFVTYLITQKDPYDTFDWLFSQSKSKKKVVFFMSGGSTSYDNLYSITDAFSKKIVNNAIENKYEIGVHPSYMTFESVANTDKEVEVLKLLFGAPIRSGRQHILRFNPVITPGVLSKCGLVNDYTLGYSDRIGFRCGSGLPFLIFDWRANTESSLTEFPLVVMDGPLLMENEYDVSKAASDLFDFLCSNNQYTMIVFNFHNSIFADTQVSFKGLKQLYINLNNYIYKQEIRDMKNIIDDTALEQ